MPKSKYAAYAWILRHCLLATTMLRIETYGFRF